MPSVLLRGEAAKNAELLVLRHENAVLCRQLTGPVRYEPADRFWFAALSGLVDRHRWREIFPVTPGTLLAWHRKLVARIIDVRADLTDVHIRTTPPLPKARLVPTLLAMATTLGLMFYLLSGRIPVLWAGVITAISAVTLLAASAGEYPDPSSEENEDEFAHPVPPERLDWLTGMFAFTSRPSALAQTGRVEPTVNWPADAFGCR